MKRYTLIILLLCGFKLSFSQDNGKVMLLVNNEYVKNSLPQQGKLELEVVQKEGNPEGIILNGVKNKSKIIIYRDTDKTKKHCIITVLQDFPDGFEYKITTLKTDFEDEFLRLEHYANNEKIKLDKPE